MLWCSPGASTVVLIDVDVLQWGRQWQHLAHWRRFTAKQVAEQVLETLAHEQPAETSRGRCARDEVQSRPLDDVDHRPGACPDDRDGLPSTVTEAIFAAADPRRVPLLAHEVQDPMDAFWQVGSVAGQCPPVAGGPQEAMAWAWDEGRDAAWDAFHRCPGDGEEGGYQPCGECETCEQPNPYAVDDRRRSGALSIVVERSLLQLVRGYGAAHDAQHSAETLVAQAGHLLGLGTVQVPWCRRRGSGTDHVEDLKRAGALIAAAIDRLRAAQAGQKDRGPQRRARGQDSRTSYAKDGTVNINDRLTTSKAQELLTALMHSHGFTTSPQAQPWWVRVVQDDGGHDVRQLVRTVLWGLGARPNPHLLVQSLADAAAAPDPPVCVRIPLTQSWDEVRAEFERVVLPDLARVAVCGGDQEFPDA